MRVLLSVAGFDPTSGAGITKDMEVFQAMGFHGLCIPTSFVLQGPSGVRSVSPVPLESFSKMLKIINDDAILISGIKCGVLTSKEYIVGLSSFLDQINYTGPLIIDPVLKSKNGHPLLDPDGIRALKEFLMPKATAFIPNPDETEVFSGVKLRTLDDVREAQFLLVRKGPKAVIIKGFLTEESVVDIFFDGKKEIVWRREKEELELHGSGCTFSAIFLASLALNSNLETSFLETERIMDIVLREAYRISSSGYSYSSLSLYLSKLGERFEVLRKMRKLKEDLERLNPVDLIPEVHMNVGYAVRGARGIEDVCAFPGRISAHRERVIFKGEPEFGSSSHVARALLTYMRFFPDVRCCANLRYKVEIVERAKELGFVVLESLRSKEPEDIKSEEGRSLDFIIESVLKDQGIPPDIIYDRGDFGKEPMVRLFARDTEDLIKKMEMLTG